jgi:hypothetical protein
MTPAPDQCSGHTEATWIGLGGVFTGKLGQIGSAYNVPGIANHQAWWEVVPDNYMTPLGLVSGQAGDTFSAALQYVSNSAYWFHISDLTKGYSDDFTYQTSTFDGSSADFIVERITLNGNLTPLSAWLNNIPMSQAYSSTNSTSKPVGGWPNISETMYNFSGHHSLAHPGSLYNSGTSFNTYYDACA